MYWYRKEKFDVGWWIVVYVVSTPLQRRWTARQMFVLCRPQTQIHDLKQAQNPSSIQLRSTLLDPAVNLLFQRMKTDLDSEKEKLEQAQNDLSAWKFTPDRWWKVSRNQLLVARTQRRMKVNWTRSSLAWPIRSYSCVQWCLTLIYLTLCIEEQWITFAVGGTTACFAWNIVYKNWLSTLFWLCCFLAT